ncbi:hypothetical protein ABLA30_05200 [Xenorhabdus nematophila]|nr:hypothetical protein [Xenorhabdus nematophila]CEK23957.1 protein of unknown function [Xenorhabdus nematophila AN6/1]
MGRSWPISLCGCGGETIKGGCAGAGTKGGRGEMAGWPVVWRHENHQ